ncbi:hypothetical protein V5799_008153 [Amblyomma americanum]|uniref:HTH psq-type domain-containing protein n=1 Tax=Amblyomma americanum TaxID=6943 RepID=A0AAQ4FFU2_AMBAM
MCSRGKYCAKTVKEKAAILREVDERKASKVEISKKHGIPPSTLSTYVRNRKAIEDAYEAEDFASNRKRLRLAKYPEIETAVITTGTRTRLVPVAVPTVFSFPEHPQKATEYNYAVLDTPKTLKRKFEACSTAATSAKKRLERSLQRERRLRRKVATFNDIICDLRKKQLISDDASQMLERCFKGVPLEVMTRLLGQTLHEGHESAQLSLSKYSPLLRMFALTLQFYSAKA